MSPPGGGGVASSHRKRRTLIAPELNLSLDHSEGSLLSDDFLDTPDDLDINVDDIDTPDETDSLEFITNGNELEWEGEIYEVGLWFWVYDFCPCTFSERILSFEISSEAHSCIPQTIPG